MAKEEKGMSLFRRWRWINKVYARLFSYFWLPCPVCKEYFGGHEYGGSIREGQGYNSGRCICYKEACKEKARKSWANWISEQ